MAVSQNRTPKSSNCVIIFSTKQTITLGVPYGNGLRNHHMAGPLYLLLILPYQPLLMLLITPKKPIKTHLFQTTHLIIHLRCSCHDATTPAVPPPRSRMFGSNLQPISEQAPTVQARVHLTMVHHG